MTEKTVEFTCMPAGRQADLYLKKVNQGKLIPEFKNLCLSVTRYLERREVPGPAPPIWAGHSLTSSRMGGRSSPLVTIGESPIKLGNTFGMCSMLLEQILE